MSRGLHGYSFFPIIIGVTWFMSTTNNKQSTTLSSLCRYWLLVTVVCQIPRSAVFSQNVSIWLSVLQAPLEPGTFPGRLSRDGPGMGTIISNPRACYSSRAACQDFPAARLEASDAPKKPNEDVTKVTGRVGHCNRNNKYMRLCHHSSKIEYSLVFN